MLFKFILIYRTTLWFSIWFDQFEVNDNTDNDVLCMALKGTNIAPQCSDLLAGGATIITEYKPKHHFFSFSSSLGCTSFCQDNSSSSSFYVGFQASMGWTESHNSSTPHFTVLG